MHRSDLDSLLRNPVWHEVVATLKETMASIVAKDFANLSPFGEGAVDLARQQGRYKMAEFVLMLPEDILREIELEEKREERKEDGSE